MKRIVILFLSGCLLLSGCTATPSPDVPDEAAVVAPEDTAAEQVVPQESEAAEIAPANAEETAPPTTGQRYIDQVVEEVMAEIVVPGMSEYEIAKACTDYLIETVYFTWPIAMDVWRIRDQSGSDEPYTFVENRALSPLLFGLGNCEDYASALTLMLNSVGMEAKYQPGLTYTSEGVLVGHAWTLAKVDGVWYHIDAELTDGISTSGSPVNYRYFLKSNGTMRASHYWGQNLIDAGLLTEEQNEMIRERFLGEDCPQDYPTPESTVIVEQPRNDADMILAAIEEEWREYESLYGGLPEMEIDTTPPLYPNGYYIGGNLNRGSGNGQRSSTWG